MGLDFFGVVNFFRGTSSPLCDRSLHPGYLIGDGFILDCFSLPGLLTEGPGIWVPTEGSGTGVPTLVSWVPGILTEGPGIWVLTEGPGTGVPTPVSSSALLTFVNSTSSTDGISSSDGSASLSSADESSLLSSRHSFGPTVF